MCSNQVEYLLSLERERKKQTPFQLTTGNLAYIFLDFEYRETQTYFIFLRLNYQEETGRPASDSERLPHRRP